MPSFRPDYLLRLRFGQAEVGVIRRLGEARGRQDLFVRQHPERLDTLRTHAVVESTETSNRIGGVVAPPGRLAELVVKRAEPRNRSEQEIAGYRDALQLIHQTHASIPISVNVILQLHQMLYRYQPGTGGRWKAIDNQIVERDARGRTPRGRFDPTPPARRPAAGRVRSDASGADAAVDGRPDRRLPRGGDCRSRGSAGGGPARGA